MFSKLSMLALATVLLVSCGAGSSSEEGDSDEVVTTATPDFQISLAQWSLHKTFFGASIEDWVQFGRMLRESPDSLLQGEDPMNFPKIADGYGINSIELVNTFYYSKRLS